MGNSPPLTERYKRIRIDRSGSHQEEGRDVREWRNDLTVRRVDKCTCEDGCSLVVVRRI